MTDELMLNVEDIVINEIASGANRLGIAINYKQSQQLQSYIKLLQKWNKYFSLTAIIKTKDIVKYHILDGLTIIKHFDKYAITNILDVGSGMGVPGIILAVCYPDKLVTLLDSNQKKTVFLQQVIIELGLKNVTIINNRIENFQPQSLFDVVISRAFSNSELFIKLAMPFVKKTGELMMMKSKKIYEEAEDFLSIKHDIVRLVIPDSDEERFLLRIYVE